MEGTDPLPKTTFEKLLFSCRWLLTPFYVALVVTLIALLVKVVMRAYGLAINIQSLSEEDVILGALGVVDLTLTACLVVLVVFSTYSNFVARIEATEHQDWPSWNAVIGMLLRHTYPQCGLNWRNIH